jgi:hypothetical protein
MVGLKSIVFDEEERLRAKGPVDETSSVGIKFRQGGRDGKKKDVFEKRNSGVEERGRQDMPDNSSIRKSDKV